VIKIASPAVSSLPVRTLVLVAGEAVGNVSILPRNGRRRRRRRSSSKLEKGIAERHVSASEGRQLVSFSFSLSLSGRH